ncbi:MAG: hypothetical protein JXA15_03555 [Spirochaetales bacterium]|nr:hypothetical protein [Spirochaetales bacterium]
MKRRGKGDAAARREGSTRDTRFLFDACALDRLLDDGEAAGELAERRDLRLLVAPVVAEQLAATPDAARRAELLALAEELFARVAAPTPEPGRPAGDAADLAIMEAARAAKAVLVTDDRKLLEIASRAEAKAMAWREFRRRVVLGRASRDK